MNIDNRLSEQELLDALRPLTHAHEADPSTTAALVADETGGVNPKDLIGVTKPRLHLVPPVAQIYIAMGLQDGAMKYGRYNWRTKPVKMSIYLEACARHLLALSDGENDADDSGWPHDAHASACLAIIQDARHASCLVDDRPPKGGGAELIRRMTAFMAARARGEKVTFSEFIYEAHNG
jgi:hypothetical protein